jgi:hypothetical protein
MKIKQLLETRYMNNSTNKPQDQSQSETLKPEIKSEPQKQLEVIQPKNKSLISTKSNLNPIQQKAMDNLLKHGSNIKKGGYFKRN